MNPDAIPEALRDREQWVCWRTECQNDDCGKRLDPTIKECPECGENATKTPVKVTGGYASSTDSATWEPLQTALDAHRCDRVDTDGIGFVFDGDGLIAGIDLDDCRDPETGEIVGWATDIVERLDSFAEVSPSGTGLHVYVYGFIPEGGNKTDFETGEVEMYDNARYFTVTGDHLDGTTETVEQRQGALKDLHSEVFGDDGGEPAELADFDPEDADDGDFEIHGHGVEQLRLADPTLDALLQEANPGTRDDTSDSDFATCARLLHWGYDTNAVGAIMRRYRDRPKLLEDRGTETYLERTVRKAAGEVTGDALEPVVERQSGDDADTLAYWKLRHAAVAHEVVPPDAFIEREGEDGDTYIGFPGRETYNRTLRVLAENGVDHGRETVEAEAAADGGTAALAAGGEPGPDGPDGPEAGDDDPLAALFREACERRLIDPARVATAKDEDDETIPLGVGQILPDGGEATVGQAVMVFNRRANELDGTDTQAVVAMVITTDLQDHGEFFQTDDGRIFYYYDEGDDSEIYRVDGVGRRILNEDFQAFVWGRYNLSAGRFSRNLGDDLVTQARREAPVRPVYRFAHYDEGAGELYVSDWGRGYYAVSPEGIEWRANGTDLFFLTEGRAVPYEYLEPDDRQDLPDRIPGELPMWAGVGDPLKRLFANRINFDESAGLGPLLQRYQLYVHLHTLPFIDQLPAKPIMAWVGESGAGKTAIQRSIGRFIFGPEFTESLMPDDKSDFMAKVLNQSLAFVDNFDGEGNAWANDVLAAVATGAGIDLRELYTTMDLYQEVPRCWLSITSRDPPFRRDDVARRTLVFRVDKLDDDDENVMGLGDYLRQVTARRDMLWSTYLDNLQAVVAHYHEVDTESMTSTHRMADWAIFATIVADALDIDRVDDLLETMEAERATFALEDEDWAAVIGEWINDDPAAAAEWRTAGDMVDPLKEAANESGLTFDLTSAQGLGGKLSRFSTELGELYDLEIDTDASPNQYRFAVEEGTTATRLKQF